jgi:hypothetical protein
MYLFILNKCEIATIYTESLKYEFQNTRINLQNIRSHSTVHKHPAFLNMAPCRSVCSTIFKKMAAKKFRVSHEETNTLPHKNGTVKD